MVDEAQMAGVEIKADIPAPTSWAAEASTFIDLMNAYPWQSAILFFCVLLVITLMPGGVGPSWVKYRGVKRDEDRKRVQTIEDMTRRISKRAERRQRGRQKGQRR